MCLGFVTKKKKPSKDLLSSKQLLVLYDPARKLVLSCDVSSHGIGAVFSHVMGNGEEHPFLVLSLSLRKNTHSLTRKPCLLFLLSNNFISACIDLIITHSFAFSMKLKEFPIWPLTG